MYSAAILEVTHHGDCQIFKRALCLVYRIEVEHCLRWVLVGSVACIYYRCVGYLGGVTCGSFKVVTHNNQVDIVADHLDSVLKGFSLGRTCGVGIRKSYYTASESVDSCFKTKSGAG